MGEVRKFNNGYRSLFWPVVLIGVGLVWLLGNLGIITGANLGVLVRLWPLLLIAIGLDMLFGRQSPVVSVVIGVGVVAVAVGAMLVGPSLGLVPSADVTVSEFSEPIDAATSAQVNLSIPAGEATVTTLSDSSNLIEVEASHIGTLEFTTHGSSEKIISLRQREQDSGTFGFFGNVFVPGDRLYWDVGLSDDLPLALNFSSGAGSSNLDLRRVQLSSLDVNMGAGQVNLQLPAMDDSYNVNISGGAGEIRVGIADGAALNLNVRGGVGQTTIDVPNDAAVRIDARSGVGGIDVPAGYIRTQGGGDSDFVGSRGVWETEGFESAGRQIVITFNGGVGGLNVR